MLASSFEFWGVRIHRGWRFPAKDAGVAEFVQIKWKRVEGEGPAKSKRKSRYVHTCCEVLILVPEETEVNSASPAPAFVVVLVCCTASNPLRDLRL
jgi:hypothetical protein